MLRLLTSFDDIVVGRRFEPEAGRSVALGAGTSPEAARLEFRDVTIVKDDATGETILEIEVRGKRGIGWCKSTKSAVQPFKRLQARLRPSRFPKAKKEQEQESPDLPPVQWVKPTLTDRLFPTSHRRILNKVLKEESLKKARRREPGGRLLPFQLGHQQEAHDKQVVSKVKFTIEPLPVRRAHRVDCAPR